VKETRVQHEILAHRELAIKRERLRHVPEVAADLDAAGFNRLPKNRSRAFGGRQQSRQHLHRRRLAAAVGAEKAKYLAALDLHAHVIDGGESAEALSQAVRLDGDFRFVGRGAWGNYEFHMALALFFREQIDEAMLQIPGAGALHELGRCPCREDFSLVHRDDPIPLLRLVHIGRRDDDAHARATLANVVDERPELAP
jgi:hypothetical protein